MKIQYCSDLHLEFPENKKYLSNNPIKPVGEVLLLAGDVVPFAVMDHHESFFDFVSDHFQTVYWLPGNHEYYHSDLADRCGLLNEKIRSNVWLVNNVVVNQRGFRFIFSSLWTMISLANRFSIQQSMSDFRVIRFNGRPFTPNDYNEQHESCLDFLKTELSQKIENTIVVSHHVPTFLNYPPQFKGDILNEAFAVELFDWIEPSGVNYWIYGHHHQPIPEFLIGNTKLLTNQLGYVRNKEHLGFKADAVIEL